VTIVAYILLALCVATVLLCLLVLADDRQPEGHVPRHGLWTQEGETTRLAPPPDHRAAARAGVLRPSEVFLVPEPGEDEWRFPPFPGQR
jgi:hypothetical protein